MMPGCVCIRVKLLNQKNYTKAKNLAHFGLKQGNFKKILMPRTTYGAMSVTSVIGLVTLTFDLLTFK